MPRALVMTFFCAKDGSYAWFDRETDHDSSTPLLVVRGKSRKRKRERKSIPLSHKLIHQRQGTIAAEPMSWFPTPRAAPSSKNGTIGTDQNADTHPVST